MKPATAPWPARLKQQITAWLFLPEDSNPLDVTLELIVRDHASALRRYRVIAKREGKH